MPLVYPLFHSRRDCLWVSADVRYWHLADIDELPANVRFWGKADIQLPPITHLIGANCFVRLWSESVPFTRERSEVQFLQRPPRKARVLRASYISYHRSINSKKQNETRNWQSAQKPCGLFFRMQAPTKFELAPGDLVLVERF
jgi:hypothetical protein